MKSQEEFNHYEILEISCRASSFEIRQAYKEALAVYGEDSLVTYSFFTDEERRDVLKRIEEAFFTLIDEDKRAGYDELLVQAGKMDRAAWNRKRTKKPIPLFQNRKKEAGEDTISKRIQHKVERGDIRDLTGDLMRKASISGKDLRALRESVGVELEEIFEVARVSVPILCAIEEDDMENLPSSIYLRNFLKSYAEILKLDATRVVEGYVRHIRQLKEEAG